MSTPVEPQPQGSPEDPLGQTPDLGPEQGPESFDRLIDEILDGVAPPEQLGAADAPGQSWRDLAMLRQATELFDQELEVPDQTHMILSKVHAERGFVTRRVLHRISSTRASIAAGLLVALGLYAFSEHMGLGTRLRSEVEPVSRLSESTSRDTARVNNAIRSALLEWSDAAETSTASPKLASGQGESHSSDRLELMHRDAVHLDANQFARGSDADLRLRLTLLKQHGPASDEQREGLSACNGQLVIRFEPPHEGQTIRRLASSRLMSSPGVRELGMQNAGWSGAITGPFDELREWIQTDAVPRNHMVFGPMWSGSPEPFPGNTPDFESWTADARLKINTLDPPILTPESGLGTDGFPSDLPR